MSPFNISLRARGGFEVDAAWENGKLTRTTIRSQAGEPAIVRFGARTAKLQMKAGESFVLDGELRRAGGSAFQDETNMLKHQLANRRRSRCLAAIGQGKRDMV